MTRWLVGNKLEGLWKKAAGVQFSCSAEEICQLFSQHFNKQGLNLVSIGPSGCSVSTSAINNNNNNNNNNNIGKQKKK